MGLSGVQHVLPHVHSVGRNSIESCFEEAKGTCGLDEYEARK